jgi:hypothetical protein
MGGLIAKRVVLELAKRSCGHSGLYITLASPHRGIELAAVAKMLNTQVDDMRPHSRFISELDDDWNRHSAQVEGWYLVAVHDQIVAQVSAQPGGGGSRVFYVDCNHLDICKPPDKNSQVTRILDKILIGKNRPRAESAVSGGNRALFVSYQADRKEWYLERSLDAAIQKASMNQNIWLYGGSGFGKTNAAQYFLSYQNGRAVYVDFSPFGEAATIETFAQTVCDSTSSQLKVQIAGDRATSAAAVARILEVIEAADAGALVIVLDEIAVENDGRFSQIVDFILALGRTTIKRPSGKYIRLAVSTLRSPCPVLSGDQLARFNDIFFALEVKSWPDMEIRQLARVILNAHESDVSVEIEDELAKLSSGSPRRLKQFFLSLTARWPVPYDDASVREAILQSKSEL